MTDDEQTNAGLRATLFRRAGEPPPSILFLERDRPYLQLFDKIGDRGPRANSFLLCINSVRPH